MLRRSELAWLIIGLGACVLLWVFLSLASEVAEGETHQFDIAILTGPPKRQPIHRS